MELETKDKLNKKEISEINELRNKDKESIKNYRDKLHKEIKDSKTKDEQIKIANKKIENYEKEIKELKQATKKDNELEEDNREDDIIEFNVQEYNLTDEMQDIIDSRDKTANRKRVRESKEKKKGTESANKRLTYANDKSKTNHGSSTKNKHYKR